ncbi:MAG TPA: efflux RND transporter periplasmic adaptor subunit [Burkholderiales bacterium]|nr:efflux RND transporter periplasmic adaptor subunit [Burkholderiales bacterium]
MRASSFQQWPDTQLVTPDTDSARSGLRIAFSNDADHAPLDAASATAILLHVQSAVLSHERFEAAAAALTNELAAAFSLERACIGLLDGDEVRVVAISHSGEADAQAASVRAVADAMHEAMEQAATVTYPPRRGAQPRVTLAHMDLDRQRGGAYCTIPLVAAGRVFGALTLQRPRENELTADEIAACEHVACLVGPILRLHHAAERPWQERLRAAARETWAGIAGSGHWFAKASVVTLIAAAALLMFLPVDYWVGATARVEGSIQRVLVAPVDGFIGNVAVRPGDKVVAGQLLLELADQDLMLERRKWQSELAQHENARHAALARGERAQFAVNQAKAEGARAQLALVEQQLNRARLSAPFDGVVIKGDLSQSIGAPVQRGQVLLTVAPANEYRLIVEVDERDIADVQIGAEGALALAALPQNARSFRVTRITPVATARDGRNFFEVEGALAGLPASVQPGLQGVAKIRSTRRSLGWIWTHRFTDWLRLTLWAWRL